MLKNGGIKKRCFKINEFIMLVGLPGSGKSEYANNNFKDYEIFSSDKLREEMFRDVNENSKNNELFAELHKRIKNALLDNKNVIFDATNINYKKRMVFLQEIKNIKCNKICLLFAVPYNECLKRNRERNRVVPPSVIERMYKNFYIPQVYEGFDEIKIIWNTEVEFNRNDLFINLCEINQDNPNHTETIGDHCIKCSLLLLRTGDNNLIEAGRYHDIGKKFTKQFKNMKGEETDICHYYQHHLVSAYQSLFYLRNYDDRGILEITNYIQWHMQPFFIKTEKAKRKFINLVGNDFYEKLMILHDADVNAK